MNITEILRFSDNDASKFNCPSFDEGLYDTWESIISDNNYVEVNTIMKINEILPTIFYHGSEIFLPVGTILQTNDDYEDRWKHNTFYSVLEKYRPSNQLAHKDSIFMCDNPDDLDAAGGGTSWVFTVKPLGIVQKHDMNWGSEIDCLISDGILIDSPEIQNAAQNYWAGIPHTNESLWEYLTPKAKILEVEPF